MPHASGSQQQILNVMINWLLRPTLDATCWAVHQQLQIAR
jgi:hypothetical protein